MTQRAKTKNNQSFVALRGLLRTGMAATIGPFWRYFQNQHVWALANENEDHDQLEETFIANSWPISSALQSCQEKEHVLILSLPLAPLLPTIFITLLKKKTENIIHQGLKGFLVWDVLRASLYH